MNTQETLHIDCSGLLQTKVHWVDMIIFLKRWSWKGYFSVTLGKTIHSGLVGNRAYLFNTTSFLRRLSCKGHWPQWRGEASAQSFKLMTLGKPLYIHFSGLLRDGASQVKMIGLLRKWSCKGHSSLTQGRVFTFIQASWETELIKSIQ